MDNWQILPKEEAIRFISLVQSAEAPELFDPQYCRVQAISVPFLKSGKLCLLENLKTAPPFTLDYIWIGNDIYYLDSGPEVFLEIAQNPDFHLTKDNVLDYLRYYCAYVVQRPDNIMVFQGTEFMPFDDTIYLDYQFDKQNMSEKDIKIRENQDKNGFIIEGPFIFAGKIDPATAFIDKNGAVRIEKGIKT